MPLEYFKSCSKEEYPCCQQNQDWNGNFVKTGAFIKNTPYAVSHYGKGKISDHGQAPVREILIAEENTGKDHKGEHHKIYQPVAYFGV